MRKDDEHDGELERAALQRAVAAEAEAAAAEAEADAKQYGHRRLNLTPKEAPRHKAPAPRPANGAECELWLDNERLITHLMVASRMPSRMRGLLGRSGLDRDEGLWISPCNSIHMFFMRFPIDVVFIDRELQVVRVHEHVKPWALARGGKFAHSVLELPAGTVSFYKLRPGDRLRTQ